MADDNIQWTSEQMIENASNWSLAGDVALLNSLKKFSESLISNTELLNAKVDNLLNDLESVSLKLELTKNEFQSLRNTQFIENRVYEDDETLEADIHKAEPEELTDEDKENIIKSAISKGLEVMRKYYDRVELAASDSEGEANENSYVLQPKDPYADRPLPYLVGTQDWYKNWHVGLLASESESESEKEEEVYSSGSDSGEHLPKNRNVGSETSSELDFTSRTSGPVANSTFNDSQDRRREVFHSSGESSEQSSSVPVTTPISKENFAEQLAAKLGDVISGQNETPKNVVKPTIRHSQGPKYGTLFSDEPPPLESPDETVLPKSRHESLFSSGRDLFSENNGNDLFGAPQEEQSGATKEALDTQKPTSSPSSNISKPKTPKGLFDNSDSSSEEDMLTVTEKRRLLSTTVTNPYMKPYKATVPFVDDQPPEISPKNEKGTPKKKPAGGISVFGPNGNIFAGKPTNQAKVSIQPTKANKENIVQPIEKPVKKTGLFDGSSEDEIFNPKSTSIETKAPNIAERKKLNLFDDPVEITPPLKMPEHNKKPRGLFDDDEDEAILEKPRETKKMSLFDQDTYQNVNIFRSTNREIINTSQDVKEKDHTKPAKKVISLFDDDDDFYREEEDIFAPLPKKQNIFSDLEENTKTSNQGLFDDLRSNEDTRPEASTKQLFDDDLENSNSESLVPKNKGDSSKSRTEEDIKKPARSLFEDFESEDDDLFSTSKQAHAVTAESETASTILPKSHDDFVSQKPVSVLGNTTVVTKELEGKITEDEQSSIVSDTKISSNDSQEGQQQPVSNDGTKFSDVADAKSVDISENVPTSVSSVSDQDLVGEKEEFNVKVKETDHLKEDKKQVLGKIRNSLGLFDSASENSSDEDASTLGNSGKSVESTIEDTAKSSNTGQTQDKPFSTVVGENTPHANNQFNEVKKSADENISVSVPQRDFEVPPPISLFDPTPPPVDWDATSDHSAESDTFSLTDGILERTGYNQSQPTASSIFDEAPPSLDVNDMNYSSGIVRDIYVSRVETDDSSFYPHASSSRRLSSDIFSDQQSQDSFFVTKNPVEGAAQLSNLERITENVEDFESKIENLTPSGNVADFENNSSVFEKTAEESKDEMYTTRPIPPKKPDVQQRASLFSGRVEEKTNNDVTEKTDIPPIKTSPGKLKHNLNINVGALLPGAARPKSRSVIAKSVSLDETDESSTAPSTESLLPAVSGSTVATIVTPAKTPIDQSEGGNFEILSETKVLHSITKDRAKIQIKRRPSTRRARQEAVRKSATDFTLYQDKEPSLHEEITSTVDVDPKQTPGEIVNILESNSRQNLNKLDDDRIETETLSVSDTDTSEKPLEIKGISLVFDRSVTNDDLPVESTKDIFKSDTQEDISELAHDLFGASSEQLKNDDKISLFDDIEQETHNLFKSNEIKNRDNVSIESNNENLFKPDIIKKTESYETNESVLRTNTTLTSRSVLTDENILKKTESDSLFEPALEGSQIFKTSQKTIFATSETGFGEKGFSNDKDEDLFFNASKLSEKDSVSIDSRTKETLPHKSGLFSDKSNSDSDDDLFGGKSKASSGPKERRKPTEPSKKSNIFGDSGDSSEEDLFGSKPAKSSSRVSRETKGVAVATRRVEVKTATVKRLENKEVTDFDPLSGFK